MALASEQKAKRGLKLPRLHTTTLTMALTLTPVCFVPSPPLGFPRFNHAGQPSCAGRANVRVMELLQNEGCTKSAS